MFREIDAECYIMVDGDDTYPANGARKMCEDVLERNVDMVVGDRLSSTYFTENKRPFHIIIIFYMVIYYIGSNWDMLFNSCYD